MHSNNMKKYLMSGVAAIAFVAALTSCTSHDFEPMSPGEIAQAKYEQAFIRTFGQPAADQDWGFGSSDQTRTRAMLKAMPTQPTFRDTNPITKPTMPTYSNTVPEGTTYAKNIGQNDWQDGATVYIDAEYSSVDQNKSNLTIYVTGNVTSNGSFNQNGNGTKVIVTENSTLTLQSVSNNLTVYLAPNATLDLTQLNTATFQNSNAAIYINNGSTVKANSLSLVNNVKVLNAGGTITATNLTSDKSTIWNEGTVTVTSNLHLMNDNAYLYNAEGKTITAGSINIDNNNDLLYNDGTVKSNGEIKLQNSSAEIVNNGTLEGTSLNMAAGGKMHNADGAITTISGKTDLTNSNSQWMNDGQYTSGSFDVDNYSKSNYNNCKLTVNGNFHLNRGAFVLNGGASVITNSFTWEDTSDFYLGGKALLKVNGDFLTKNANSGYGLRGYGSDYAVIQAKAIKIESNEQFRMSYYGNLYIDAASHFEQGYKDAPNTNQPYYYYESTVKFSFKQDACPVTIPASNCNPGYSGGIVPPSADIRIIAEDLSAQEAGDFDFNDVVFDVKYTSDTEADIILQAAGGTLPLWIGSEENEVHAWFGVNTKTMVNTHAAGAVNKEVPESRHITGINRSLKGKDIIIKVNKGTEENPDWQELTAKQGVPAAKLAVSPTFEWCNERQGINKKYPIFSEWVQNTELVWY